MYKEFYGFTRYPFTFTPDTHFLYPGRSYKDCLFCLLHSLERGDCVLVMTGDIGVGKTFLLNYLVKQLNKQTYTVHLSYSSLNLFDMLTDVLKEFGLERHGQSKAELLSNMRDLLVSQAMTRRKIVLVIDEAQNLSAEVLENLRLLTNFESAEKKCLQIILVGQRQLEETLKRPELTQVEQRVGLRCQLVPLNASETKGYIEHRLAVAGIAYRIFTWKALREIFVWSQGIPRVINIICDLALVFGWIEETREIGPSIITQVIKELNLYTPAKPRGFVARMGRNLKEEI
jgi:general secretion pathway protein A